MSTDDRRHGARLSVLGELRGEVMIAQPVSIAEIGVFGLLVDTAFPFQLGSIHDLRFTLGDRVVVVKTRVVRCSIADMDQEQVNYRTGLEFVDLERRTKELLDEFVQTTRERRAGTGESSAQ